MIMTSATVSPEWHNENALRAYPLSDDCRAAEEMPTWLLADLRVSVGAEYSRVFVSSAYLSDALVSFAVSGMTGSGKVVGLIAKTVTRDELEPGRAYAADSLDGESCGTVAFGEIPDGASPFKLRFGPDEAPLAEGAVVRVRPRGIVRITDPAHGTEASGIIDLSGSGEFRTYVDPEDPNTVVIELTDLYRDLTTSVCSSVPSFDNCGETPVRTVNGVAPDDAGNIYLRFR